MIVPAAPWWDNRLASGTKLELEVLEAAKRSDSRGCHAAGLPAGAGLGSLSPMWWPIARRSGLGAWGLALWTLACGGKVGNGEDSGASATSSGGIAGSAVASGSGRGHGAGQPAGDMGGAAGAPAIGTGGRGGSGGDGATTGRGGRLAPSPSCDGLPASCGPSANESCCTSPIVTGGTFYRGYDGVSFGYKDRLYPATVSDFRLDRYEITVGRFRKFVVAWKAGWRPAPGSGKHTHLNAGSGLADSSGAATYEPGWDAAWASNVSPTDANLQCDTSHPANWTPTAGAKENQPITCENWYEAYAFCIWDGGFLPSEVEWNYAASGGSEQRVYPWSRPASSTAIDCTYANYFAVGYCVLPETLSTNDVGSEAPKGNGKYGQADLAGNVYEWNLDVWQDPYLNSPCDDCANLPNGATLRVNRGGGFDTGAAYVLSSRSFGDAASERTYDRGARCARAP